VTGVQTCALPIYGDKGIEFWLAEINSGGEEAG
jgi:hypothetical protein